MFGCSSLSGPLLRCERAPVLTGVRVTVMCFSARSGGRVAFVLLTFAGSLAANSADICDGGVTLEVLAWTREQISRLLEEETDVIRKLNHVLTFAVLVSAVVFASLVSLSFCPHGSTSCLGSSATRSVSSWSSATSVSCGIRSTVSECPQATA